MLELYFVTQRATELLQDDIGIIVEESVEGIPLVGAAHFSAPEDGRGGCLVTLKLAYNMPGAPGCPTLKHRPLLLECHSLTMNVLRWLRHHPA